MRLIFDEPLLSADDETELARSIEAGLYAEHLLQTRSHGVPADQLTAVAAEGRRARARFVRANLRLVCREAREAAHRWDLPEEELFQEGAVGLLLAVDRFDHARPVRFATYALPWIRSRVARAVARRCGDLHLNRHGAELRRAALAVAAVLESTLGREPRTDEIARELGKPASLIEAVLMHAEPRSLTAGEGRTLDRPDPRAQRGYEEVEERVAPLRAVLDHLDDEERAVVVLRFGFRDAEAHSVAETARRLGLSSTGVRRREQRALARLRDTAAMAEAWAA